MEFLAKKGWQLTYILNTHHHGDHVGGNLELKQKTGCKIVGALADRHRIPGIDVAVSEGETVMLGQVGFTVMATPGHTSGHIVYYAAEEQVLFCGDTLFVTVRQVEQEDGCLIFDDTIQEKAWTDENAGLAKSPTRTVTTQNNHIFMFIYAVFKLECLKIKHKANHFALRAKLFIKANQMAYEELQKLRAA